MINCNKGVFNYVVSPMLGLSPTVQNQKTANTFLAGYKTTLHCKSVYYSSGFPCDFTVTMAELIPAGIETELRLL